MLASHGTRGRAAHQFAAQKAGEKMGKIKKGQQKLGGKKGWCKLSGRHVAL